jgi:hypothetical protein
VPFYGAYDICAHPRDSRWGDIFTTGSCSTEDRDEKHKIDIRGVSADNFDKFSDGKYLCAKTSKS